MSLLTYFKEITISWKLSLFAMVFCIWPMSAYLIFPYDTSLFISMELVKLTLISSAISSPLLVVNIAMSFLLLSPKDETLSWANSSDQLFSGTVLAGIGMTLWVLASGAVVGFVDYSLNTAKTIMSLTELTFILAIIWSKWKEDRRFARRNLQNPQTENTPVAESSAP